MNRVKKIDKEKCQKMSAVVKSHMHKLVPKQEGEEEAKRSFASMVEEVMNKPQSFKDYLRSLPSEMETNNESEELVQHIRNNLVSLYPVYNQI